MLTHWMFNSLLMRPPNLLSATASSSFKLALTTFFFKNFLRLSSKESSTRAEAAAKA